MRICAILPLKHNSQRVKGKNYRNFNGKPLFTYILDNLLKCKNIDLIIIDTNSSVIKNMIHEMYKNTHPDTILIYDRPSHLCACDVPMNDILKNVIEQLDLDYTFFLQTHSTNPLLKSETIENAINDFIEKEKLGYDSLFSVKSLQTRLYTKTLDKVNALNHNPEELKQTQDLEPLYEENSCLYIFKKETLFKKNHRIGFNPHLYVMNDIESTDIDTEYDFTIAELLHKSYYENKNKLVLVTGAAGGIGIEICKKFKKKGWVVIGTSRRKEFDSPFIDHYISADITNETEIQNIIDFIRNKYNKINCIVNNAAAQICKSILDMTIDEWDKTYNCNVKSIFLFVKYGIDMLKSSNGNIINIGSVHSINTSDHIAAYASTKAAIAGLTKNLAIELSKFNIRVNCISPGAVDTPMLRAGLLRGHVEGSNPTELVENLGKKHLLKKVGQPCEIANLVEFVANDSNGKFINGSNILIDGGASIKLSTE